MILSSSISLQYTSVRSSKKKVIHNNSIVNLEDPKQITKFVEKSTIQSSVNVKKKEKKERKDKKKKKSHHHRNIQEKVEPENFEEDLFPTLTLTYEKIEPIKEEIKITQTKSHYLLYDNIVAKFTNNLQILRFKQEVDLIYKVRFELKASTDFTDNFVILGLIEKSLTKDYDNLKVVSCGMRPRRGDFIGVYVNRITRLITFEVNHFILDSRKITEEIINKVFNPFLFIQQPNGVLRINSYLEDEFK